MTKEITVSEVAELFLAGGASRYDEGVSLTTHCIQTARLAEQHDAPDALVVAALLHDVGHLLLAVDRGNEHYLDPDWDHDAVGAAWLAPRFGDAVAGPVGHHVAAKRYLTATEPDYFDALSDASRASLAVQGGPFTPTEAHEFLKLDHAAEGIALRRWDDDGKVPVSGSPDGDDRTALAAFADLLHAVAQ